MVLPANSPFDTTDSFPGTPESSQLSPIFFWSVSIAVYLSAEDVEGLDLQDVTYHRTAHRPAIAGGSVLGIVISDIEFAEVEGLG